MNTTVKLTDKLISKSSALVHFRLKEKIYVLFEDDTYDKIKNQEDLSYYLEMNYPIVRNLKGLKYKDYEKSRRQGNGKKNS